MKTSDKCAGDTVAIKGR